MLPRSPHKCSGLAAFLYLGTHHLDPTNKNTHHNYYRLELEKQNSLTWIFVSIAYKDSEVAWSTGYVSSWGQSFRNMFQTEGCW